MNNPVTLANSEALIADILSRAKELATSVTAADIWTIITEIYDAIGTLNINVGFCSSDIVKDWIHRLQHIPELIDIPERVEASHQREVIRIAECMRKMFTETWDECAQQPEEDPFPAPWGD